MRKSYGSISLLLKPSKDKKPCGKLNWRYIGSLPPRKRIVGKTPYYREDEKK